MIIFLFLFSYSCCLFYLIWGIAKQSAARHKPGPLPPVSIIVVCRNEEKHLAGCLQALTGQKYPRHLLQIIFIDDGSIDATPQILKKHASRNDTLTWRKNTAAQHKSRKKNAFECAIKMSKADILLFTDADCRPGKNWAAAMAANYTGRTGLVAGFSPQSTFYPSPWNDFLLVDSLAAAAVAAGSIGWGSGTTCSGRNLSFRKTAFAQMNGFENMPDTPAGTDDFIVQGFAGHNYWQTKYTCAQETVVPAQGPPAWRQFLIQKQRHLSAAKNYTWDRQTAYFIFHTANSVLWAGLFWAFWGRHYLFLAFIFKLALDAGFFTYFSSRLGVRMTLTGFLMWEILFPVYHIVSGFKGFFGKAQWQKTR